MKDTPAAIERRFRRMLMQLPGAKRLKMGCSMHATAQALAKAYLSERRPDADPRELKRLLFPHFYNSDFNPDDKKRILSALSEQQRFRNLLDASKRTTGKPVDLENAAIVKSPGAGAVREKGETYDRKRRAKTRISRSHR